MSPARVDAPYVDIAQSTMTRASERAALDGERSWQKMGDFLASMGGGGRKVAVVSPILVGSEPK
jgi:hypothetical protein